MEHSPVCPPDLSHLSAEEKKRLLFDSQKELLDTFLARKAITRRQYDKSLGDLREKMGFPQNEDKTEE